MSRKRISFARAVLVASVSLAFAACGEDDSNASEESNSNADNSDGNEASDTTTGETSAEGGDGDAEGDTGSTDGGNAECLLWELDECAEGLKCMPYSSNTAGIAMETRCCDLAENPKLIGEPCSIQDYWGACLDDCENGAMCLMDEPDSLTGICRPFCDINLGDNACITGESCKPWFEMIEDAYTVPMCMPKCHPLEQNCGELGYDGWTCLPDGLSDPVFVCTPPPAGNPVAEYGTCLLQNQCEVGLSCVPQEIVFGCEDAVIGCCTRYCDITEPNTCTNGNECVSAESSEPGLENVGICASNI